MVWLLLLGLCVEYSCVYFLERSYIIKYLRKAHSKTFLRKLKQGATTFEKVFGFYLKRDGKLTERWLSPALILANLDLLTLMAAVVATVLNVVGIITEKNSFQVMAILGIKSFIIWLGFFFHGFYERICRSEKRIT